MKEDVRAMIVLVVGIAAMFAMVLVVNRRSATKLESYPLHPGSDRFTVVERVDVGGRIIRDEVTGNCYLVMVRGGIAGPLPCGK